MLELDYEKAGGQKTGGQSYRYDGHGPAKTAANGGANSAFIAVSPSFAPATFIASVAALDAARSETGMTPHDAAFLRAFAYRRRGRCRHERHAKAEQYRHRCNAHCPVLPLPTQSHRRFMAEKWWARKPGRHGRQSALSMDDSRLRSACMAPVGRLVAPRLLHGGRVIDPSPQATIRSAGATVPADRGAFF